jgi:hypothetical protein
MSSIFYGEVLFIFIWRLGYWLVMVPNPDYSGRQQAKGGKAQGSVF